MLTYQYELYTAATVFLFMPRMAFSDIGWISDWTRWKWHEYGLILGWRLKWLNEPSDRFIINTLQKVNSRLSVKLLSEKSTYYVFFIDPFEMSPAKDFGYCY